jgi:hypothetical protein
LRLPAGRENGEDRRRGRNCNGQLNSSTHMFLNEIRTRAVRTVRYQQPHFKAVAQVEFNVLSVPASKTDSAPLRLGIVGEWQPSGFLFSRF